MGVPRILDHIVLAGPDLAALVEAFERATGARATPGGRHPTGTANALVACTRGGERVRQYLELIGPDAEAGRVAAEVPRFGIDQLAAPRVASFAIAPADLDATIERARAAGHDYGDPEPLSRRTPDGRELAWRLGLPRDEQQPPFLIDWGTTPHPALDELPTVELVALRRRTPDVEGESARLAALGVEVGDGADALQVVHAETAGFEFDVVVDGTAVTVR
ncbi:Glyoxalase-like domain-containing protein [Agrococcus baldri]|uniref:Glyoxalase-like domain-containing protein n=1 Tax=Agrococcus baldri TaxID=153730 RepID=A0AA94HPE0_9MICO|nr:Glyoxalase-like domain-containing protein [Agrococcus baldri]